MAQLLKARLATKNIKYYILINNRQWYQISQKETTNFRLVFSQDRPLKCKLEKYSPCLLQQWRIHRMWKLLLKKIRKPLLCLLIFKRILHVTNLRIHSWDVLKVNHKRLLLENNCNEKMSCFFSQGDWELKRKWPEERGVAFPFTR